MIRDWECRHLLLFLLAAALVVGGLLALLWMTGSRAVLVAVQAGFFAVLVMVLEVSRRWWLRRGPDGEAEIGPLLRTTAPGVTVLVRLAIGPPFLWEGLSILFFRTDTALAGADGSAPTGAEFWTTFAGVTGTAAGALIILGLLTRPAAFALLLLVLVAIGMDGALLPGSRPDLEAPGSAKYVLPMQWPMLLGSLFLLIVGAGSYSIDSEASGKH